MNEEVQALIEQTWGVSDEIQQTIYAFEKKLEEVEEKSDVERLLSLLRDAEHELDYQSSILSDIQQLVMLQKTDEADA